MTTASTIAPAAAGRRIVVRGATKRYTARGGTVVDALAPLDLEIAAGSFVAVAGPSGCGKTTLLRLVAGLEPPTEGVVQVGGEVVRGPSASRGVVFQQPNLYPWLSVRDNVAFGPRMRGVRRAERHRIADGLLDLVGLSEFARAAPYELSGGMRQRCQIAAVLANDPPVMLLDEPFAALDAVTRERLQDALLRIRGVSGATTVFITHSAEEAVYLANRVVVMSPRPGRIVDDVTIPYAPGARVPPLRADPGFVALRERVAAAVRADHPER